MTRARSAVLQRRTILLGAALVAGCKHEPTGGPPPEVLANPNAYQVSDPVVAPCRFHEGDALLVERRGTTYRVVGPSPSSTVVVVGPSETKRGQGEVLATLADTTNVSVEVDSRDDDRCEATSMRVTVPWSTIADGASLTIPIPAPDLACRVADPVVTIERVLASGVPTLRIRPTSPRVTVSVAGGAFASVVDVESTPATITIWIAVSAAGDGGVACRTDTGRLMVNPSDLPALGEPPKAFTLPR